jgi:hypothetical protein
MVPPLAVQVTAVLLLPVTVAVNCWVAAACSEADVGLTLTETVGATPVVCLYRYTDPPPAELPTCTNMMTP